MEYAVVKIGGKQYKVAEGDILEVDRLPVEKDGVMTFDEVLLWVADGQVKVGTPFVKEVRVKAKVLEQKKGEKIRVAKFKAKVRYRRVMGFRPLLTRLHIEQIEFLRSAKTSSVKAKTKPKKVLHPKVS